MPMVGAPRSQTHARGSHTMIVIRGEFRKISLPEPLDNTRNRHPEACYKQADDDKLEISMGRLKQVFVVGDNYLFCLGFDRAVTDGNRSLPQPGSLGTVLPSGAA